MNELCELSAHDASRLLLSGDIKSVELTEACLQNMNETEPSVKACITVCADTALQQAREADDRIALGKGGPLTGIPFLIKDNIATRGIRTTCASRILNNFVPPFDATVIEKIKKSGVVILGKTNMDEFAMGSSTENSAFFPTRNPWDTNRVPGGSSGGSAAAVAARQAPIALGSDTGGSIRQPAGFCNVVGMKPTYGRVSRYGLVAFASSLDQIGPITRSVSDCALALSIIAGHDPMDSTSYNSPVPDFLKALKPNLKGIKIGIPKEYYSEGIDGVVKTTLSASIKTLSQLGAEIDYEISLPHTRYALSVYYIIAPSEASANLSRYDGVKYGYSYAEGRTIRESIEKTKQYGFGAEVKRRIMLGTYALSAGYYDAYYLKAQKVRTIIINEFKEAFKKCDALVTPTSPSLPFRIGEKIEDPLQMYLSDVCTIPSNIAGIPAITVPAGFCNGLPVGMQILGRHLEEEMILRIAYAYENATGWYKKKPSL